MDLVPQLFSSGFRAVIAATGGGSGALSRLLTTPGASALVLEGIVPYAPEALAEWLGRKPEQACSDKTARQMAMVAFLRARKLSEGEAGKPLVGIGCTASLATTRPKRGEHRLHVAAQTAGRTLCLSLHLEKGARSRAEEEAITEHTVLAALADAVGVRPLDLSKTPPGIEPSLADTHAEADWSELLLGQKPSIGLKLGAIDPGDAVLVSGSFDPLHRGHEEIARVATEITGRPALFELSIANADKPPLDFTELRQRLDSLGDRPTLLTMAPTFVEKARLFPGCVFAVGVDTLARIAEPRFYSQGALGLREAIKELSDLGCRFLVYGRKRESAFQTLAEMRLPSDLLALCDGVEESAFRVDISSSEIRATQQ